MEKHNHILKPQIKICGFTRVDEAVEIAKSGLDAMGFVFYPKSPRNVSNKKAKEIIDELPSQIAKVGVFVNESFQFIMEKVEFCGLNVIQLHGSESPELVQQILNENLKVVKVLYLESEPQVESVYKYNATAYLVECKKSVLPGGNALKWDWGSVKSFGEKSPLIVAGGLSPENISEAIVASIPDVVDVSSGVEIEPGRKSPEKAKLFIKNIDLTIDRLNEKLEKGQSEIKSIRRLRRIF